MGENGSIHRQLTRSDAPDRATGHSNAPGHLPAIPGAVQHAPGVANPPVDDPWSGATSARICGLYMRIVNGTPKEAEAAVVEIRRLLDGREEQNRNRKLALIESASPTMREFSSKRWGL